MQTRLAIPTPNCGTVYYSFLSAVFPKLDRDTFSYHKGVSDAPLIPEVGQFYPSGVFPDLLIMTPEQQEIVNRLFMLTCDAIRESYEHGLRDGRDLLSQLAKGDLTIGDFENARNSGKVEEE
jgi:hypothetical protein